MDKVPKHRLDEILQRLYLFARSAGMQLTLDHYKDLSDAVMFAYGLGGWSDLERITSRLWVKPHPGYTQHALDKAFIQCRSLYLAEQKPTGEKKVSEKTDDSIALGEWPLIPPGKSLDAAQQKGGNEGLAGMQTSLPEGVEISELGRTGFKLFPTNFPVSQTEYQMGWQHIKQKQLESSSELDLDLEATIDEIGQKGIGADLVLSPLLKRGLELVLLIDDSVSMQTYRMALNPLFKAIETKHIHPVERYRFEGYPGGTFAPWTSPTAFLPLDCLLSRWNHGKTILLVWSDAGSAPGSGASQQVEKTLTFLRGVMPCVRQLFWVNPMPKERWQGRVTEEIAKVLNGRMLEVSSVMLDQFARNHDVELWLEG